MQQHTVGSGCPHCMSICIRKTTTPVDQNLITCPPYLLKLIHQLISMTRVANCSRTQQSRYATQPKTQRREFQLKTKVDWPWPLHVCIALTCSGTCVAFYCRCQSRCWTERPEFKFIDTKWTGRMNLQFLSFPPCSESFYFLPPVSHYSICFHNQSPRCAVMIVMVLKVSQISETNIIDTRKDDITRGWETVKQWWLLFL